MLRIALCDDEINELCILNKIVIQYCEDKDIKILTNVFTSGHELLLSLKIFDIIFLDIEMDNMNGIELAKQIRNKDTNVKIIYVTGYSDYQNYAFSVHAFGYIIKPFSQESIYDILSESIEYIKKQITKPVICLKIENKMVDLKAENIYYFEYCNRKMKIVHVDGVSYANYGVGDLIGKVSGFGFIASHKIGNLNNMILLCKENMFDLLEECGFGLN